MKLSEEQITQLAKDLEKAKSYDNLISKNGVIEKLIKFSLENILEVELSEHFNYKKYSQCR